MRVMAGRHLGASATLRPPPATWYATAGRRTVKLHGPDRSDALPYDSAITDP